MTQETTSGAAELEALRAQKDQAYRERNEVAAAFARTVASTGTGMAWVGFDPDEPEWPVLYVETPVGQVSWHMAPSDADLAAWFPHNLAASANGLVWDGHTPAERAERLLALTKPASR